MFATFCSRSSGIPFSCPKYSCLSHSSGTNVVAFSEKCQQICDVQDLALENAEALERGTFESV